MCNKVCLQPHTYIPAPFRQKIKLFVIPVGIYNGLSFSQQEQQNSEYKLMHSLYLHLWINIYFYGVLDHRKTPVPSHRRQYRQILTSVKYNPDIRQKYQAQYASLLHCHCSCQHSWSLLGWISISRNVVLHLPLTGNASSASVCRPQPERNHATEEGSRVKA